VLRVARGERAVQDEHFELFTEAKTLKMTDIQDFQNFDVNFQKKSKNLNILETVSVTENL